jgi:hypothetical protein
MKDHLLSTLSFIFLKKYPSADQIHPESNRKCLLGIATKPEFKIRPSLTTSKEGLKTRNIYLETTRM